MLSRPEIPVTTRTTQGKRAYFRAPVWLAATGLAWGGKRAFTGWVDNLSAGGMHLVCAFPPPPETACLFRLNMGDGEGRDVFVTGWVAHARTGGMGIQFDLMAPKAEPVIRRVINRCRGATPAPALPLRSPFVLSGGRSVGSRPSRPSRPSRLPRVYTSGTVRTHGGGATLSATSSGLSLPSFPSRTTGVVVDLPALPVRGRDQRRC